MTTWMQFLLAITPAIWELYERIVSTGVSNDEEETHAAMLIVRAAKDFQARRELERK